MGSIRCNIFFWLYYFLPVTYDFLKMLLVNTSYSGHTLELIFFLKLRCLSFKILVLNQKKMAFQMTQKRMFQCGLGQTLVRLEYFTQNAAAGESLVWTHGIEVPYSE